MGRARAGDLRTALTNRVLIEDVGLVPTLYEEAVRESALVITLRASVGSGDVAALRALYEAHDENGRPYYRVRREGIDDQDRRMRFGRVLWQEAESGVEVLATLVDQPYDVVNEAKDDFFGKLNEPRLSHVVSWAAGTAAQMDALLAALRAGGVLSGDVVDHIDAAARDAERVRGWDLARVSELDEW